jgi:hypothetical protein
MSLSMDKVSCLLPHNVRVQGALLAARPLQHFVGRSRYAAEKKTDLHV